MQYLFDRFGAKCLKIEHLKVETGDLEFLER